MANPLLAPLLGFLGNQVLSDRLRKVVREELGAAYAPGAFADSSEVFPGIGSISIVANAEPAEVDALLAACRGVLTELVEEGVPEDEVARLSEPLLAKLRDAQRTNPFWLEQLALAQRDPARLDDIRDAEAFFQALPAEALGELAKTYLDPERASLLVVTPKEASAD